ncbi:MAG: tRNA lysidine(34) synthetase TilS [Pseudomonadota bacterium]
MAQPDRTLISSPGAIVECLQQHEARLGAPERVYLGFSGGLDSTLLLSVLAGHADWRRRLTAVHVNHGLHPDSAEWAEQCRAVAGESGVDFKRLDVEVDTASGDSVEAAARHARYAALGALLDTGDWLFTAHHLDDQIETLLLNLLRGSGPDGLAAMPAARRLGAGWLLRPLLGLTRSTIEARGRSLGLRWLEDPGNAEPRFDRNYLRREVIPVLKARWPDLEVRLLGSIDRAQEASGLLRELGAADLARLGGPAHLDVLELRKLSAARRRNLVRQALRELGLPLPPLSVMRSIEADVIDAADDRSPHAAWPGAEVRRYRARLFLMPPLAEPPSGTLPVQGACVTLPAGLGTLAIDAGERGVEGLSVGWRHGGESIRLHPAGPSRKLKKLLQDAGIVPWMRNRMPLLYRHGELVAVADRFAAQTADGKPVLRVEWSGHPPLS